MKKTTEEIKKDSIIRLKEALSDANMTQAELCRRTGIDKASISYYLSGRYYFKSDKAKLMADVLKVSPVWLMGFDVNKHPKTNTPQQPSPEELDRLEKFMTLFKSLSPEKQQIIINLMKELLRGQ